MTKVNNSSIGHVIDAVNVAGVAASYLNDSIHPIMNALVELSDLQSMDINAIQRRIGLIQDLAKLGRQLVEEAAGNIESDEREMKAQLTLLQGGLQ